MDVNLINLEYAIYNSGITAYQLAKDCELHPQTIYRILNVGKARKSTLRRVADRLNVSIDYLLEVQ